MNDLAERRNIVMGITGSIAAYKSVELVRMFVTRGYNVRCVMTQGAVEFISPLTLESVSGKPVLTDFWNEGSETGIDHIELATWADVLLIAPATADVLAKLSYGFSDTPLLAVALATQAPIVVAPAMNVNMFEHPATQQNVERLVQRGVVLVDPDEGALACGWNGTGRLAKLPEIFMNVRRALSVPDFTGKRILISTGPTREPIDPVRYISNRSSGKMGVALAVEAYRRGAEVHIVHGPISPSVLDRLPHGISRYSVATTEEMHNAMMNMAYGSTDVAPDIVIMAAAVADYRTTHTAEQKLKKSAKLTSLALTPNPDILKALGDKKGESGPLLVGFAIETGELADLLQELNAKLKAKSADLMVGNFAEDAFDLDTNRVWIIDKHGRQDEVATTDKHRVADRILNAILKL